MVTDGSQNSLKAKKGVGVMKAGIFFTGSGPIVILTSYASLKDSRLVEKLATKGIKEFVAFEVPPDMAKEKCTGIITMLSLATFTSRMTYGYSITMGIMSSTSFV